MMFLETLFNNLQSTAVFLAVLSVLIVVHEWGHFITAKILGVAVEEFALGFGPTLFAKKYHGTNYMLKLFPLGGYVKMVGDERVKCSGNPQEFFSKSPGQRSLIVFNGPVINFILAYVSFVFVFMLGYPDLAPKVGKLIDGFPAQVAGLKESDLIVGINAQRIENWTDIQKTISDSKSDEIQIEFVRNGQRLTQRLSPKIENRKNIFGQETQARLIGIIPSQEMVALKYNFGTSLVKGYQKLVEITVLTYKSLYFMLTGSMSAKESMTGPIGIFYIIKNAAEMGFAHLLFILGVISASLAIFNLLPVIPLDGGHLLLFAIEKVRGKVLPARIEDFIARIGFSLIILLAVFVFYSDFARFGWLTKIRNLFP